MDDIFSINIMCLGNWNKKIFTPSWVAANLFELKENKIEAFFNPNEMEMGYKLEGVTIFPKDTSVELKLDEINDKSIKLSGKLLNRLLTLLPHTPLRAIGVNVRYKFDKKKDIPIVNKINRISCKFDDFATNQIKFSKELEKTELNIIIDFQGNEYIVNFNFHHNIEHYPEGFDFNDNIIFDKIGTTKKIIENE
ncbi:MAG: hypothetical protein ACOCP4_05705 [Candidatus Woesearchaeota archaeon]